MTAVYRNVLNVQALAERTSAAKMEAERRRKEKAFGATPERIEIPLTEEQLAEIQRLKDEREVSRLVEEARVQAGKAQNERDWWRSLSTALRSQPFKGELPAED